MAVGTTTSYFSFGTGAPSGAPAVASGEWALYQNTANGNYYFWNLSGTPGWTQISGATGTFGSVVQGTAFKATGLTGATTATRYAGATASGAPVSGTFIAGDFIIDLTGSLWVCTVGGSPGTWVQLGAGGGGGGSLTSFSLFLGSDVALSGTNTDHDILTNSCAGGTWMFWASLLTVAVGNGDVSAHIWDGSTNFGTAEVTNNLNEAQLSFMGYAVLGSTTTVKLTAQSNAGGNHTIKAATFHPSGNFATQFFGLKVA